MRRKVKKIFKADRNIVMFKPRTYIHPDSNKLKVNYPNLLYFRNVLKLKLNQNSLQAINFKINL